MQLTCHFFCVESKIFFGFSSKTLAQGCFKADNGTPYIRSQHLRAVTTKIWVNNYILVFFHYDSFLSPESIAINWGANPNTFFKKDYLGTRAQPEPFAAWPWISPGSGWHDSLAFLPVFIRLSGNKNRYLLFESNHD